MPNYQKNDVRHADHKKQMSEVKRIEKLEKKAVKAAKHTGKKSGKPQKYKSYKKKGNSALRNVQTSGVVDQRGIRVPFNEALPSIMNSTDGKLEIQMRKTLNPGLAPDAGTDIKSINNGVSVRTSKAAKQWLRHQPHFSGLSKQRKADLSVYIKNRANKQWSGIYGVTYMSSSKMSPPDTVEKLKNHAGTKWANITESIKFDIPIAMEKNRTNKLVRAGTPVGLVVDGTTDLKEAFDIDEYDWGYIVFWSQGVVGSTGTPITTATPLADPMVKGSWYFTERTDDGDVSASYSLGPLMDQYKVTKSYTSSATGDQNLTDVEFMPTTVWPQTAPSNLGSNLTNPTAGQWFIHFPVVGAYLITLQISAREVDPGYLFSIHESNSAVHIDGTGVELPLLYDVSTGDTYRTPSLAAGLNVPATGAIGRFAFVTITDTATQSVKIEMNNPSITVNRSAPPSGVGQLGIGWDMFVCLVPTVFIPAAMSAERKRELEFERRVNERVKNLEAKMGLGLLGRPKVVGPPPLRSLSETRKQKLAQAVSGEISPTPSVVADLKGYSLFTDNKDSKDEKTSKK